MLCWRLLYCRHILQLTLNNLKCYECSQNFYIKTTATAAAPTTDGIGTRRSARTATKTSASDDSVDLASVQMTVDSHEMSLVSQQANPILLLDPDQVRKKTFKIKWNVTPLL